MSDDGVTRVEDPGEIMELLKKGYVLHPPVSPKADCELVLPLSEDVDYECPWQAWTALNILFRTNLLAEEHKLVRVWLKEPNCGGGWRIVTADNKEALKWEATAEEIYEDMLRRLNINEEE